ncbi:MAG TPA: enoyl-CoA hydratase/isomerase family protein [Acidimicrobiia bacterium]|nr:enoyl-CoA hydratase/isomerase family protein [Acidimicrobiia bacterium]
MIKVEPVSAGVTLVRFDHGRVSALDLEFLLALRSELAALAETDAALVLTGTGSAFSAGVDLVRMLDGGADYAADFIPALVGAFDDLFAYRRPVVAAVNGHAVAGGCIIACCADHRFMADGRGRIGIPEQLVGVPFPAIALAAVRYVVGDGGAVDLANSGVTLLPGEAKARGLVDEVVPEAELLDRAIAKAEALAAIPPVTFAHTKRSLRDRFWTEVETTGRQRDAEMLEGWKSPAVHAAIADYVKKTLGK